MICSLLSFWPHFKLVSLLAHYILVALSFLFLEQTKFFLLQGLALAVGFAYHPLPLVLHITEASEQILSQEGLSGLLHLYYHFLPPTIHTTASYFIYFIMYLPLFEFFLLLDLLTHFYQSLSSRMQDSWDVKLCPILFPAISAGPSTVPDT